LRKILHFLDEHIEEYVAFSLFAVMLFVLLAQILLRYTVAIGIPWSDEVARFSFQWVIYLGISLAMKEGQHIKIDAVMGLWPKKLRSAVIIFSDFIIVMFGFYLVYGGYFYVAKIFRQGSMGVAFQIPLGFVYLAIPVGYALTCIRAFQGICREYRRYAG
jgi:TRAP-type C4-dicarboxylate transport system permease small subunit